VCYDLGECIRNCGKNKPPPDEALKKLIGLKKVKDRVEEQKRFVEGLLRRHEDISKSMNFLFLGNPGTGKTTVAKLMGKIFARIGALQYSKVIETGPKALVDRTQGEGRARDIFNRALGGVLFIDEAYGLLAESGGMSVVTELIAFSENNAGNLCIILAGYPDEMNRLLAINTGFASRFQRINFDNYSAKELLQIFDNFCKEKYIYNPNGEFSKLLHAYIEYLSATPEKGFGNARVIRNLFETLLRKLFVRTAGTDANEFTADDMYKSIDEMYESKLNLDSLIKKNKPEYKLPSMGQMLRISRDLGKEGYNKQALTEALIRISTDKGTGSGFLITSDGYAVTCNHVIKGRSGDIKARVRIRNSRGHAQDSEYNCVVIFQSEGLDIAVIKLETKENNLPFTALMPRENEPQDWQAREVHLLSYPFGSKFDDPNLFKGYISSCQEVNGIETLLLGIEGKCGSSGGMCIDIQSGFVTGIFCGSFTEKNEGLTEEINYAHPIKYLWDIFEQEPDRDKNRN
jgi:adenylate kinase family enzyme